MAKFQDMCFQQAGVGETGDLSSDAIALLQAFDGITSISDVRKKVELDNTVFKNCFLELFKKKLITEVPALGEPSPVSVEYLDQSTLQHITNSVILVAGPMGEVLVNDALEELGMDPSCIPKQNIHQLIETISSNIPGEKQRKQFLETMPPE